MTAVLHVHGQAFWHCTVTIIGNREALTLLHGTIEEALTKTKSAATDAFAADGEGYTVEVRLREADLDDDAWQSARLPYYDESVVGEQRDKL